MRNFLLLSVFIIFSMSLQGQGSLNSEAATSVFSIGISPRINFETNAMRGFIPVNWTYQNKQLKAGAEIGLDALFWQKSIYDCNCQPNETEDFRLHTLGFLKYNLIKDPRFTEFNLYGEYSYQTQFKAGLEVVQDFEDLDLKAALLFPFTVQVGFNLWL